MSPDLRRTVEGQEAQFGGNHVGHFLLVSLLWPRILQAATEGYKPRVVCVSSEGHAMFGGIRWDDPNLIKHPEAYSTFIQQYDLEPAVDSISTCRHIRAILCL